MTALAKIILFYSKACICQYIGSDRAVKCRTNTQYAVKPQVTVPTQSFTDLETPPEWKSVFCSHTNSRNVHKQSDLSWDPLAAAAHPLGVEVSWRSQRSRTQPASFYLAASVLWSECSCSSCDGPEPCYDSCLCGRGGGSRLWSCVCCWVHPCCWCHAVMRGCRIAH